MKTRILSALTAYLILTVNIYSQTQWTKYAGNPVLVKGPDAWDAIGIGQPTVLWENDTIKMWYIGVGADFKGRLCYAYSLDGINWVKHNNIVMDVGGAGAWDRGWLDTPEIVRDSSGYKLYYYGDTAWQFSAINSAIGVAYSTDGINWTKEASNPIFTKGTTGEWDDTWVESPAVIFDYNINGPYKMWYNGMDTTTWRVQIGLATSMDGITWVKHTGNPVLSNGNWGTYDDMWLGTPAVLYDGNAFEMWYSSTAASSYNVNTQAFDTVGICYATSTDGINWVKHPLNPVFNTFTAPYDSLLDSKGPWAADVVFNPNTQTYMLWFEAAGGFMLATAPKDNVTIADKIHSESVNIYPNPASEYFIFENMKDNLVKACQIIVYDVLGREVAREPVTEKITRIETSYWPSGVYILNWINNNTIISRKLIKN